MGWVTYTALFFIIWWTVLFAVLPFGLKTQDDDQNVVLGTPSSAPRGPHMLRAVLWTTLVSFVVLGSFYGLIEVIGFGLDDIPNFLPQQLN
ncbi:DUF1467 family protein [Oryzicola mucosus]|uniref:DUF1467 family protein n=1 Tax=Oryzicola mucosus TaxID=2767425 RepID=A0A8J6U1S8_9HYPH|nr:DUF1467 family protein [Oryzicola mucosus]MBD0414838.1 DUF1467 family protein [Oryzicola mucosus]